MQQAATQFVRTTREPTILEPRQAIEDAANGVKLPRGEYVVGTLHFKVVNKDSQTHIATGQTYVGVDFRHGYVNNAGTFVSRYLVRQKVIGHLLDTFKGMYIIDSEQYKAQLKKNEAKRLFTDRRRR